MKGKKSYAFFLLIILGASVLLLSLSYAKESMKGKENKGESIEKADLRIVCSSTCTKVKTNEETTFAITNLMTEARTLALWISPINQEEEIKVFLNGNEQLNLQNPILWEFSSFGEVNDFKNFTILIKSEKETEYNIKIEDYEEKNTLLNAIKIDDNIYQEKGNYYYYGENPSNYILYNDSLYQIIGIIEEDIKLISPVLGLGTYKEENNYATLKDYQKSFGKEDFVIEDALSYKSWMTGEKGFWLKDQENNLAYYASKYDGIEKSVKYVDLYIREVVSIKKDTLLLKGEGTIENPYEVVYESE